jgi:beta-mannosidase
MGSLVWQLDDCWPVASWSSIDYYGRWKALHYYIKRSFSDVVVAFEGGENDVKVYVISDKQQELKGTLVLEILDLDGKKIIGDEKKVKLAAGVSELVWKSSKKDLLKKTKTDEVILKAQLFEEDKVIAENVFLFVPHKALKLSDPAIKYDFVKKGEKLFIELKSNKVAFGVSLMAEELDLRYSDNYFTLVPKETKIVEIISDAPDFEIKNKLTVKSLIDSYEP